MAATREEALARLRSAVGQSYEDSTGRTLVVDSVHPGDPDGREVRGTVIRQPGLPGDPLNDIKPYATSALIFQTIWLDQVEKWIAPEAVRRGG